MYVLYFVLYHSTFYGTGKMSATYVHTYTNADYMQTLTLSWTETLIAHTYRRLTTQNIKCTYCVDLSQ